ncbi:MAG TPA: nucleotidyltransferase family protein [Opitutaceae bacterium]|jgi:D-glycero-alpha-D-manno-heptose 1-phosphate guanylyltransferase|nr:nucleotidyltransferase family protein [Opitutaceae bacterium]
MSEANAVGRLPTVVLLAGGFGTRLRSVLPDVPKPMAPVAGRPFVEWIVRFFARHGARDFVLSTGHLAGQIERHFAAQPVPGVTVSCRAETIPLGTAGGFLHCAEGPGPWLVANGDSLVFADPHPLLRRLGRDAADAAILGLRVDDASRYGTLEADAAGRLTAFREKRPGAGAINSGVYAFTAAALRDLPAQRPLSFEFDVFPALAAQGRVAAETVAAPFLDIGTPASLAEADRFILQHPSEFLP